MINYEVLLERCKREETKEIIIQCLDKASIDHQADVKKDFIDSLEAVGVILLIIIIGIVILSWIFK